MCRSLLIYESAKSIPDLSGKMCLLNSADQPIHPLHISLEMVNESEYSFSASWIISFRSIYNVHFIIHLSDSQDSPPSVNIVGDLKFTPKKKVIMLSLLIKRIIKGKTLVSCLSLMASNWCSKIPYEFPLKDFQMCLS